MTPERTAEHRHIAERCEPTCRAERMELIDEIDQQALHIAALDRYVVSLEAELRILRGRPSEDVVRELKDSGGEP